MVTNSQYVKKIPKKELSSFYFQGDFIKALLDSTKDDFWCKETKNITDEELENEMKDLKKVLFGMSTN